MSRPHGLKGYRRLRVGSCMVIYGIIASTRAVFIIAIKHRKDVYED